MLPAPLGLQAKGAGKVLGEGEDLAEDVLVEVSKTPRELVTTTPLSRTSGDMSASTPAAATCTHCTDPAACHASTMARLRKS